MYLTKETKAEIFKQHGGSEKNTGSAEGQIALFTFRINHLTEHLRANRKDYNTERSLVRLVGKRRSLLDYLKQNVGNKRGKSRRRAEKSPTSVWKSPRKNGKCRRVCLLIEESSRNEVISLPQRAQSEEEGNGG